MAEYGDGSIDGPMDVFRSPMSSIEPHRNQRFEREGLPHGRTVRWDVEGRDGGLALIEV